MQVLERRSPLVSIGVPVYNGQRYLEATLEALLSQTIADLEVVVSDNASNDATEAICRSFAQRDKRIVYSRNDWNLGAVENFKRTLQLSSGAYFMWAADHDQRATAFVERCLDIMRDNPNIVLAYPRAAWMGLDGDVRSLIAGDADTRDLSPARRFEKLIWKIGYGYPIYGLMRRDALLAVPFPPEVLGSDVVLLAELSQIGEFACIDDVLLYMRRMPDYGNWRRYVEKMNRRLGPFAATGLMAEQFLAYKKIIDKNFSGWQRFRLTASLLGCMSMRQGPHWIGLTYEGIRGKFTV